MQIQELKQYLEGVKRELGQSNSNLSKYEAFVKHYYEQITNKHYIPSNCNSCVRDALLEMYVAINKNTFVLDRKKYKLKRGKLLTYMGINYTSLTLTDDIAEDYLSSYPDNRKLFFEDK